MTISAPPLQVPPSCQGDKRPSGPPKGRSAEIVAFPCSATVASRLFDALFGGPIASENYRRAAGLMGASADTWERLHQKKTSARWELVHRMLWLAEQWGRRAEALKILGWAE